MLPNNILPDEELTDLCINHWKVLQKKQGFRFSIDAVLLAHFIQPAAKQRLLDLGTGSAVIPLLVAARHPDVPIDGIELQPAIAAMAQRSVQYNQLQQQIRIIQYDLTKLPKQYEQQYDWVTSNPPFFPVGTGKQNPNEQIALSRHEIACNLKQLVQCSARCLKSRGHFALIHRAERLPEILSCCMQHRLAPYRLRMVHPAMEQPANLVLLEAIKDGHNNVTVLPPLPIYRAVAKITSDKATYSDEVLSYYQTNP